MAASSHCILPTSPLYFPYISLHLPASPRACSAMAASSHCNLPLLLRCGSAQPVNLPSASHVVSPCRTSTCVRAAACDEAPVHTRAAGSGVAHESAARLGSTEAAEQTHANRALARRAARPDRGWRPGREQAAAAGDHEKRSSHLVRASRAARIRSRSRGKLANGAQVIRQNPASRGTEASTVLY